MGNQLEKAKLEWENIHPEYNLNSVEIFALISLISNIINKKRSALLKKIDLEPWSFDTLSLLRRSKNKILNPSQFMEELNMTSGTMTHRIDLLEQQGLVVRKKNNIDGRNINIELTKKGQTLIDKALKTQISESDLLLSEFPDDKKRIILDVLNRLLDILKNDKE